MSSNYKEELVKAKAIKLGIIEVHKPKANRKKPKVKGPWKVVGTLFGKEEYIWHHCETEELARKMLRKQSLGGDMRIEYREATK
jgi:hypothetical protein